MNKQQTVRKAEHPRDVANRVAAYLAEGDLEGILTLFHPDCLVYFPPNEPPKKGLPAIRELFTPFIESKSVLESKVTGELINDDIAMLQAKWKVKAPNGDVIAEGSSTEVTKQKKDGSWVYYIDCPYGPPSITELNH